MKAKELYEELKQNREESWKRVLEGKLKVEDFIFASFNFLVQFRYKPVVKSHDRESILYNYIYWTIQIERKIMIEKKLVEYEVASQESLNKVLEMHIKRRDQMVRRLLWERKEPVAEMYLIFEDTVEIVLKTGEILYSTLESLNKIRIDVKEQKKSKQAYYSSLLKTNINLR